MIPRRELLKRAGVATTLMLGPRMPVWSQPSSAPPKEAPSWFMALSSALLGIKEEYLRPPISQDAFNLADVYFGICSVAFDGKLDSIVRVEYEAFKQHFAHATAADAADWALNVKDQKTRIHFARRDTVGSASRLIALLWLYGVWYGGTEIGRQKSHQKVDLIEYFQKDFVVSSRAYKDAWIWRIAQAHAMGYSHFNFGSWAEPPPALFEYGISLS